MSWFRAQPGKRPLETSEDQPAQAQPSARSEPRPLFAAGLGPRSDQPAAATTPATCPLCRGALLDLHGIWCCQGRCMARWVQSNTGQLIDLTALPYGLCSCCERPQPLSKAELGAVCPHTGDLYLLYPDGPVLLREAAPDGLCPCCQPAQPLQPQGQFLACSARPTNRYRRIGGRLQLEATPVPSQSATLAAIDQALRQNVANVNLYGVFDIQPQSGEER